VRFRGSFFLKHCWRRRRTVAAMAGILSFQALCAVLLPYPMRFLLDYVLVPQKKLLLPARLAALVQGTPAAHLLAAGAGALALLYLVGVLSDFGEVYWMTRTVNAVVESARNDLARVYVGLRAPFVEGRAKADLVARISQDTAYMETLLSTGLPVLVRAVPSLALMIFLLSRTDWRLGAALSAVVAVMFLMTVRFTGRMRRFEKKARAEVTRFERLALQTLEAFPLVKSLGLEPRARAELDVSAHQVTGHLLDAAWAEGALLSSLSGVKYLMRLTIFAFGGYAVLRGRMTVGTMVFFLSYVDAVGGPVKDLSKFVSRSAHSLASIERIEELLDAASGAAEEEGASALAAEPAPALRLEDVAFSYPNGPPLLRGFSAVLRPGDLVAVVGPSGAGKSTLLMLLNRLRDPSEGRLLLGASPLASLRLDALRGYVTSVAQEPLFLSGTVRENLALARPRAVEAELWSALERAAARDFVAALPEGLDTVIGDAGRRLPEAQARQLGAARAFLRPARGVFAFDEPTTGLDPSAAAVFARSAGELAEAGAIVVWSTRDLDEVRAARRAIFLRPGQAPLFGPHEELLRSCADYAAFARGAARDPGPDDAVAV